MWWRIGTEWVDSNFEACIPDLCAISSVSINIWVSVKVSNVLALAIDYEAMDHVMYFLAYDPDAKQTPTRRLRDTLIDG